MTSAGSLIPILSSLPTTPSNLFLVPPNDTTHLDDYYYNSTYDLDNDTLQAGNWSDDYDLSLEDLLYRHSVSVGTLLCLSYVLVFILGLIGNCFVIAVVFR